MRIAFIGTSHISALKTGWEALPADLRSGHDAIFIGYSAPSLSQQTHVGWLTEGDGIHPTQPSVRYFLELTSGSSDTPIKPLNYDVVCFVDMFFCYDFSVIYARQMGRAIIVDDVPVSDYTYTKILEPLLGESQYSNHPKVGDVPNNSQEWLLKETIRLNPDLRVFLTPRPFMPAHRLKNKYPNWSDPNMVCRVASLFDVAVSNRLKDLGIVYIPRTKEQVCPVTGATPDNFSVGWIDEKKTYNEHMNSEYGRIICNTIIEMIC